MERQEIIVRVETALQEEAAVRALWLEGADAAGSVDEYSDIDICIAVAEADVDGVFARVLALFETDGAYQNCQEGERQLVFHVKNASRFLWVDFNAYFLTNENVFTFMEDDPIESAKVLFDKDGLMIYRPYEEVADQSFCEHWRKEGAYRLSQVNRVEKYCLRREYPEAYAYYHKYIIEPIVSALRIKYTPSKPWYYLVHISRHIPDVETKKLNRLLRVASEEDILNNLDFAVNWYRELTGNADRSFAPNA